jgi:allophanate hydrolase
VERPTFVPTVSGLHAAYRTGARSPDGVVAGIFRRIRSSGLGPVWISLADEEEAMLRAKAWDPQKPLAGIPFAVKDNIDVKGMPTTAGCPSFAYVARQTAAAVVRLLEAGAILIGKTNMDQFATGLVGVRTPYGACSSIFDDRYISGGSSSGSAVAVAHGLCAFSLGTDTAGSGRVPAAFNGLVGLKPTRGTVSTDGVVPACRSLDCVSIFTHTAGDAERVWSAIRSDEAAPDSGVRSIPDVGWRFGVPRDEDLRFFGDADAEALFRRAVERCQTLGGTEVRIDYAPFREAAALLYEGPWVAERYAAVGEFLKSEPLDADPTVAKIILSGERFSAVEAFRAFDALDALRRRMAPVWREIDVLVLPTTGTIYTKAAVAADPIALNANLGYYTNFVNLMDLAAVAVPAGVSPAGLPFGLTFIGRALSDRALLRLAQSFGGEAHADEPCPGRVQVGVVGAHLSGQPLNAQLIERGARLVYAGLTAPAYRLYALAGTEPQKPGLVRTPGPNGAGIEVEVWEMPEERFGSFVNAVPAPLAIGSVELATGQWVKGFLCEAYALAGARDITACGGWRGYLSAERM